MLDNHQAGYLPGSIKGPKGILGKYNLFNIKIYEWL